MVDKTATAIRCCMWVVIGLLPVRLVPLDSCNSGGSSSSISVSCVNIAVLGIWAIDDGSVNRWNSHDDVQMTIIGTCRRWRTCCRCKLSSLLMLFVLLLLLLTFDVIEAEQTTQLWRHHDDHVILTINMKNSGDGIWLIRSSTTNRSNQSINHHHYRHHHHRQHHHENHQFACNVSSICVTRDTAN